MADQGLDTRQGKDIRFVGQGDGLSRGPRSGGPADPMDVVLGILWNIVVDHMAHPLDMETAGGDICRHQNRKLPLFKGLDHFEPYSLVNIAGDRAAVVAVEGQPVGERLGTPLGIGEDQNPFPPLPFQEPQKQGKLFFSRHMV